MMSVPAAERTERWTSCLFPPGSAPDDTAKDWLVGVFPGEGIGPELISVTCQLLRAVADACGRKLEIREGGPIGRDAERVHGVALPPEAIRFCREVFASGGAILSGPGGGRYVYELRQELDLFLKISPARAALGAPGAGPLKPEVLRVADILLVRENTEGLYQGRWRGEPDFSEAHQEFSYRAPAVRRFLTSAARLARARSGKLTVAWKESGVPAISRLWQHCAAEIAAAEGVTAAMVDIDLLVYRLVAEPGAFDVIAAPNLFGDVLGDLGATLLGSRGISFSGNFSPKREGVYQTNHGAAYDLAGQNTANPAGQILSAAMMLRESFGCAGAARAVEAALCQVWESGLRTRDCAVPGCRIAGTSEFAHAVAERAARLASAGSSPAPR